MKKIILVVLLIAVYANPSVGQIVTKEEYEIYSIVLNKIYKENLKNESEKILLILDKTKITDFSYIENKITDRDFKKKNKISLQLEQIFSTEYKYQLVKKDEIDKLIEIGEKERKREEEELLKKKLLAEWNGYESWKYFYKNFPDSNGYYEFSRIGFSQNKNIAKVNFEGTGSDWSSYATYLLKKIKGKWRIYDSFKVENIV